MAFAGDGPPSKETMCEHCHEFKDAYRRIIDKYNEHLKLYWEQKETLKKSEASVKLLNDMLQQDKLHRKFLEERLETAEQALFLRDDVLGGRGVGGNGGKENEMATAEQVQINSPDRWIGNETVQIPLRADISAHINVSDAPGNFLYDPDQKCAVPANTSNCQPALAEPLLPPNNTHAPDERPKKVTIVETALERESKSRHDSAEDHQSAQPDTTATDTIGKLQSSTEGLLKKVIKPVTATKSAFPLLRPGNVVDRPGLGLDNPKPPARQRVPRSMPAEYSMTTSDSDATTSSTASSESDTPPAKAASTLMSRRAQRASAAVRQQQQGAGDRKIPKSQIHTRSAKAAPPSAASLNGQLDLRKALLKGKGKETTQRTKESNAAKALKTAESSLFKEWKKHQSLAHDESDLMHGSSDTMVDKTVFHDTESETSMSHPGKSFPAFRPFFRQKVCS
ncbi:uncharacterized protein LOC129581260 isoform X2 [Paramacrobiotus metropolitanus]|uniref:uncharacterized protein LOC129581260 isoform X2 n=1 Tax=Paramacrobiotus metropolitanus TaxID=2943436 RepID=UPI0024460AE7|nr:uncharacterized protein LOC129581260 isoform X2 [Paramacrobiotus metropolitanus]